MSVTITITNLTTAPVSLDDMYMSLGAAGTPTASYTFSKSVAHLDSMDNIKALANAGTVSLSVVNSSSNNDMMSVALEQHGVAAALSVATVAVQTATVTYATPFAVGIIPTVDLTVVQPSTTTFKGKPYLRTSTATGFTAVLDVTSSDTGVHSAENPTMSPAENGALLGPFTATLSVAPITAAAITIHWAESAAAKSATITGVSTLGGGDAANLTAGTINRTTGALSVTFAVAHAPDTNSITVDYVAVRTADLHWVAKY